MSPRRLGPGGPLVFPVGLGCMGMSEFYGPTDDEASLRVLDRALDLGVGLFDTADIYGLGRNEALLGRFLAAGGAARRQAMVIATKFGIVRTAESSQRRIDNSPAYVRSACEASLRRLGIERIDLYYCHRRDPSVPIEDVVGAMADLVVTGKVGAIGLSEVSPTTLRRAHAVHPVAAVQSEYSLWSREPEAGMLATCAALGTAFVAYSPLGRAFLTATVDPQGLAPDDFRRNSPRFAPEAAAHNARLVAQLSAFASARGLSNAQVALAWLLHQGPQVIPIPGTRRIPYLEANVAAAGVRLRPDEMVELDRLFAPGRVVGGRYPEAGYQGIERD